MEGKRLKVLVVEDVPIAQKVAKITLLGLNCRVEIAEDGEKAITMFKSNSYDLIFMDIGLPNISGIEVVKIIRELEGGVNCTPIIALTANYDVSYRDMYLKSGMNGVLLKPLTKSSCQQMIEKFG